LTGITVIVAQVITMLPLPLPLPLPLSLVLKAPFPLWLPRVAAEAAAGETVVSSTVRDLVAGSGRSDNQAAAAGRGILIVLSHLLGRAACRERLLVCPVRDDLARMIRHALLRFSADLYTTFGIVKANARPLWQ
jgi:hypothetical protein